MVIPGVSLRFTPRFNSAAPPALWGGIWKSEEAVADWDTIAALAPRVVAHAPRLLPESNLQVSSKRIPRARRVNRDFTLLCPTTVERADIS